MTIDLPQIIIDACAKGFSIIPVRIDKRPFFSWKQYQQKTAPIETLRAWNEKYRPMSWAIVTGKVSDVIVIDCDGENGLETLKQLGNRPHIKTGSGGAHLYIKYPGHPVLTLNGKTKVELGDRYPGTDIRADGGYAIVWGANDSGKYEQLRELIPDTLNSLPEDLRNLLGLNIPPENQNEGLLESHPSKRNGQVSFKLLISRAIVRAKNNGRNNAGFWLACQLRDSGLAVVEAKLAMREYADRVQRTNTKGRVEPYPFREALASLRQAYAKTARRPGNIIDDSKNAERDKSKALPRIDLSIGDLAVLAKRAWSVIESSNNPPRLFRYGGNLVRIELADDQLPVIRELTPDRLRYDLARDAKWGMLGINGEWKAKAPPMHVVRDILATPDPQLPALVGIVETPIIAPDGTLYTVRGYNCKTKTYYWPIAGFSIEPIPEQISSTDIKEAVDYLRTELLGDFPFINEAEMANALALFLLPFVRELIDGPTPLHLIEKPTPGTGGTLLAEVMAYPALGRPLTAIVEGRDEDEWRKRLTAWLKVGSSVLLIDNLRRKLDSSALASVITSQVWEDRILGKSETIRIAVRCVWIATGNNPVLSSEMARRAVRIRLDAKNDRPWLRKDFRHPNLRQWVIANRSHLVRCALVLARSWVQAGKPPARNPVTLGMFENWANVMAGILEHAGVKGFLTNLEEFYEASDNEGAELREFVSAWWGKFQDREVGISNLWELVPTLEQPLDLGDKGERSQKTRLGLLLKKMRDCQFGVFRIICCQHLISRAQQWKLERIEEATL